MPKGESGRIVVVVDPELKRRLYSVLAMQNSTLKEWFIQTARQHIEEEAKEVAAIFQRDLPREF